MSLYIPGMVFPLRERLRALCILSNGVLYWRDLFANLHFHLPAVIDLRCIHAGLRQRTLKRALGSTRSTLTSARPTAVPLRCGATDVGGRAEEAPRPTQGSIAPFGDPVALQAAVNAALRKHREREVLVAHTRANTWDQRVQVLDGEFRTLSAAAAAGAAQPQNEGRHDHA